MRSNFLAPHLLMEIPNFGRIFVLENICSKFNVLIKVFKKQQMGAGGGRSKEITETEAFSADLNTFICGEEEPMGLGYWNTGPYSYYTINLPPNFIPLHTV